MNKKMDSRAMFTSSSDEWATPQALFDELNEEFNFDLDPCATEDNAKCENFYTLQENGLEQSWGGSAYLLIHHTPRSASGLRSVTGKAARIIQPLSC